MHLAPIRAPFVALALFASLPLRAGEPAPFWRAFAGSWVSEAAYVDAQMRPIVARYATLMRIETTADAVLITEWKFYPHGELARGMAGGNLPAGKGLETISFSVGRPAASDPTAIEFGADRGLWTATTADLAAGVVPGRGDAPRYRFVAALSGAAHAVYSAYGYADDGALKGLAVFRMARIASGDEAASLDRLRSEFAVGRVIDSRPAARR